MDMPQRGSEHIAKEINITFWIRCQTLRLVLCSCHQHSYGMTFPVCYDVLFFILLGASAICMPTAVFLTKGSWGASASTTLRGRIAHAARDTTRAEPGAWAPTCPSPRVLPISVSTSCHLLLDMTHGKAQCSIKHRNVTFSVVFQMTFYFENNKKKDRQ